MFLIELAAHPLSRDKSATLVWAQNYGRIPGIYSSRGGFVATLDGDKAIDDVFQTQAEAMDAIASMGAAS